MTTFETELKEAIREIVEGVKIAAQFSGPGRITVRIDPVLCFAVVWGGPLCRCCRYEAVLQEIAASEEMMGLTVDQVQWLRHMQPTVADLLGVAKRYAPEKGLYWRCSRCAAWHVDENPLHEDRLLLEACGFDDFKPLAQWPCDCGVKAARSYDDERDQT